jgi:MOSC domain-containing protein YiiM
MSSRAQDHRVLALWIRPREGAPLEPRDALEIETGRGIVGDHSFSRLRHVTIVFEDDWDEAAAALGRPVDPIGRRANVLVSGGGGIRFVGTRIRLGPALAEIKGITRPCPVMERAASGLQAALEPNGRGGVWGRILEGGMLRLGDVLAGSE